MAVIVDLALVRLPEVRSIGSDYRNHTATWEATTDEPLAADHVIALAQELVGQLPGGVDRIPRFGEPLLVDNGRVITGVIGGLEETWVNVGSGRYGDGGAVAMDFAARPAESGYTKTTFITVTFRAPMPGRYLERAAFRAKFGRGGLTSANRATTPTVTTGPDGNVTDDTGENILAALAAASAPKEFHIEYRHVERSTKEVRIIDVSTPFQDVSEPQPFVNPLGEELGPVSVMTREQIVTVETIVATDDFGWAMNSMWMDTMNADAITFQGQIIPRYRCQFLGAETSRTQTHGTVEYKILTYRVLISHRALGEIVPMTGTYYLDDELKLPKVDLDNDGNPIDQRYPLKKDGTRAEVRNGETIDQHRIVITHLKPKSYGSLLLG